MIGSLVRLVLLLVVIAAAAAFFMGYRVADLRDGAPARGPAATPAPAPQVDTGRARDAGAKIGETVAVGANQAQHALGNASLTAKIKAKMTLDDTVKAARIDVDTTDGVVTLTGTVSSQAERTRALQLARETDGVKTVHDRLVVR
jgi:hyperosmotically inducible protein